MFAGMFRAIFGSKNDRELRRMSKVVKHILEFEEGLSQLSDADLQAKTPAFKERLSQGATLDEILPEAYATVREAGKRVLGMRHFDCQMIGGITLHQGRIGEMRTGEGKTYVATLPVYLNALSGLGVHVVTVNDYLAERDANWMRPLYEFLGLSVGIIQSGQNRDVKRLAYAADITYGTNNEYGFDFLRDNMAFSLEDKVQRGLNYALVDEVDSILIDEARTPLIISGPSEDSSELYKKINTIIPKLKRGEVVQEKLPGGALADTDEVDGDYTVDEKNRAVELTEQGHEFVEQLLAEVGLLAEGDSLYATGNLILLHHVHAALKAHAIFVRNVDYIVQGGEVVIVDEHTGRTMPGRRWSDGIHQAVEAKEHVPIHSENQTLASTTFQNYFRLYAKLCGMTGTADTEAFEFRQIYGLDVVVIPTNKPLARTDHNDVIYMTEDEKFEAIVEEIKACQEKGAPVLVGTASIESSERLAIHLQKAKIQHSVLNAKFHEMEAEIIAQAGKTGAVTIATNMAGRGTDIVLGGNWQSEVAKLKEPSEEQVEAIKSDWEGRHQKVLEAGGLQIIGTERHESRRIDNQLRGRSGRQGDPGSSRFFLSMEDGLMRIFASDRVKGMMQTLGMQHGEAIEHGLVTKSIANAQKKVEGRNFDIRKSLLEYDDVANDQRKAIYEQRNFVLETEDISETIEAIREDVVGSLISNHIPLQSVPEQWDIAGLEQALTGEFRITLPIQQWLDDDKRLHEEGIRERVLQTFVDKYKEKEQLVGDPKIIRQLEKQFMLQTLDRLWKEHLASMDHLRQGIHLRGYAARNPKQEYKREAFELFQALLDNIKMDVIRVLTTIEIRQPEEVQAVEEARRAEAEKQVMEFNHSESQEDTDEGDADAAAEPYQRNGKKVGRNEKCPCGSGKKYKHCHGQVA